MKIVKDMPTLKKYHKCGLTHEGFFTWKPPSFTGTTSMSMQHTGSSSSAKYGERTEHHKKQQEFNINDLPSVEEESDDYFSYHSSQICLKNHDNE